MDAATGTIDSATAIRRVNDTLQGPVADVMGQLLPEFKGLARRQVYDRALNDLGLLERCFEAFRRERKHFRYIVVDGRHRPVEADDVPLSCGRTLQEVVAMVVRTAAKRYFRRTLDPKPVSRPAAGRQAAPAPSRADELYEAIKDYLLHEWQVPLVPAYADMSPGLVRTLGERLLTIRRTEDLRQLIAEPAAVDRLLAAVVDEAPAPAEPAPAGDLCARLLSDDGRRLRPEAFNEALLNPQVRACLPRAETVVRVGSVLREVGGAPARLLLTGLRLSTEQLTVMLFTAHQAVGAEVFARIFGQPGRPELILRVVERGLATGLGPDTPLAECAGFTRQLLARAAAGRGGQEALPTQPEGSYGLAP